MESNKIADQSSLPPSIKEGETKTVLMIHIPEGKSREKVEQKINAINLLIKQDWLRPITIPSSSIKSKEDLVPGASRLDEAAVATLPCTDGNSIEQRLIAAQAKYIDFLDKGYGELYSIAHVHHYRCPQEQVNEGIRQRDEIEKLVSLLNKDLEVQEPRRNEDATSNAAGNPTNHPSKESSSIEREAVEDEDAAFGEWLQVNLYRPQTNIFGDFKGYYTKSAGSICYSKTELYQLFLNSKNKQ